MVFGLLILIGFFIFSTGLLSVSMLPSIGNIVYFLFGMFFLGIGFLGVGDNLGIPPKSSIYKSRRGVINEDYSTPLTPRQSMLMGFSLIIIGLFGLVIILVLSALGSSLPSFSIALTLVAEFCLFFGGTYAVIYRNKIGIYDE
jgi:hypothetical protein